MAISKKLPPKPSAPALRKPTAPKLFDVARPGKTIANSTSRPLIITNHPVMQDPMVTPTPNTETSTTAPMLKPTKKLIIKPLHDDVVPDAVPVELPTAVESAELSINTVSEVPIIDTLAIDPTPHDETPTAELPAETAIPTPPTLIADPDLSATPVSPDQDKQLSPADVDIAKQANKQRSLELQKIIDNEQYFLPINSVESRRTKRIMIIGIVVILVLGLAWYDAALDASLITNTFNLPHSHFLAK